MITYLYKDINKTNEVYEYTGYKYCIIKIATIEVVRERTSQTAS
jgi:hypothetical protein